MLAYDTILSMANTFSCLNIHCVFSTKERVRVLNPDIRERLWPCMGGIAKQNGMILNALVRSASNITTERKNYGYL